MVIHIQLLQPTEWKLRNGHSSNLVIQLLWKILLLLDKMSEHHSYDMDNCKSFLELSVNERSKYLAKNKLCLGCYDLSPVNIQQRHALRGLSVKNVRAII